MSEKFLFLQYFQNVLEGEHLTLGYTLHSDFDRNIIFSETLFFPDVMSLLIFEIFQSNVTEVIAK